MDFWAIVSKVLPECRFKEGIRKIFYQWSTREWSIALKKCELLDDRVFLELKNGLRFFGISKTRNKWNVFGWLHEQLTGSHSYERYYKLKAGDVVIDVGAGPCGVFTVFAAKAVGKGGLVIAIELERNSLENLKENIKLNSLDNVIVVSKGLWDKEGQKKLGLRDYSLVWVSKKGAVEVEVDALDNILADLNVSKIDFIKMDIEGAEIQALSGMKRTLKNNDVNLAIAAYHTVDGTPTYEIIVPKLEKEGFIVRENDGVVYAVKSRARLTQTRC